MTRLGKFPIFILLLAIAACAAALFGAVHNQLSYTVGPTYFTALKFQQFGIPDDMAPRLAASWVGVQASWWMGILVGLPAFVIGLLIVPKSDSYFAAGIGAIGLVVFLSLFAALAGLLGGIAADASGILDGWLTLPDGPTRSDLLRAGFMHDASYLAGALGALVAIFPMRRARQIDIARIDAELKG